MIIENCTLSARECEEYRCNVNVYIGIKNIGSENASFPPWSSVDKLERVGGGSLPYAGTVGEPTIEPGKSIRRRLYFSESNHYNPGVLEFRAIVDPDNRVNEADETNNNILCPSLNIRQQRDFADLVITNLSLSKPATRGNGFLLIATIRNQGTLNASIRDPHLILEAGSLLNF